MPLNHDTPKESYVDFSSFSFDPRVMAGVTRAGYETPTPIQAQAIPPVLQGRDLLGLAQTGTGKTAAFVLPILQRLLGGERAVPRALILSPTRELAEQTHQSILKLAEDTGFRSMTVYGGVTAKSQVKILRTELPEIVVACPGRLLDLMGQGFFDFSKIGILVLDEADQMFDMGFLPSIRKVIAALPSKRQTLLFSATMPQEIRALAREFQRDPVKVEIGAIRPAQTVTHFVYQVAQNDKLEMLKLLLPGTEAEQTLIFTRTKYRAKKLAQQLANHGHAATSLQGNLSQGQREKAMDSFRSGKARVMVATDIAARGIDISKISHVINFDIPDTVEAYTHRIGRTGRMHREGTALTFVTPEDGTMLRSIEKVLGSPIERRKVEGFVPGMVTGAGAAGGASGSGAAAPLPFDARPPLPPRRPRNPQVDRAPRQAAANTGHARHVTANTERARQAAPRQVSPRNEATRGEAGRRSEPRRESARADLPRKDSGRRSEARSDFGRGYDIGSVTGRTESGSFASRNRPMNAARSEAQSSSKYRS